MKIYLVEYNDYDLHGELGWFTDKAKAEKLMKLYNSQPSREELFGSYPSTSYEEQEKRMNKHYKKLEKQGYKTIEAEINEVELDVPEEMWIRRLIRISKNGDITSIESEVSPSDIKFYTSGFDSDGDLVVITHCDKEEAIKIAKQERERLLSKWGIALRGEE